MSQTSSRKNISYFYNALYSFITLFRIFAPRCWVCKQPIMPEPGEEETVRVVALDHSFHIQCYKCEVGNKCFYRTCSPRECQLSNINFRRGIWHTFWHSRLELLRKNTIIKLIWMAKYNSKIFFSLNVDKQPNNF